MLTALRSRVVHSKFESSRLSRVKCSLCNQIYSCNVSFSTNSTKLQTPKAATASSVKDGVQKKPVRRKPKLTDYVEVGGTNLKQMTAKIKKLSGKNLGKLHRVESSGAEPAVSELPNDISRSASDLGELREQEINSESSQLPSDSPPAELHDESDPSQESAKTQGAKSVSSKLRGKMSQVDVEALLAAGKEKSLQESLLCYLELCVKCGFTHRGRVTLSYYIKLSSCQGRPQVTDARLFDVLMSGYASVGQYDKLLEIWSLMESVNVQPTVRSFATRIEAIARSSKHEKIELLNSALALMSQKGQDLSEMFVQTRWLNDSREIVLEAIRLIQPKFSPFYPPPELDYDNPLLPHLNNFDNSKLVSPAEGILSEEALNSLFQEQLEQEKNCIVSYKSVVEERNSPETNLYRERLDSLMKSWEQSILTALNREVAAMNAQHKNFRLSYTQLNLYPYLVVLDKQQYKDIIMQEIRVLAEGSETFSPSASMLHRNLGTQVRNRFEVKIRVEGGVMDRVERLYQNYAKWYLNPQSAAEACNGRQIWQILKHQMSLGPSVDLETAAWPPNVLSGIGKFLYKIILRDIKIDVNIMKSDCNVKHFLPAFYTVFRVQGGVVKAEMKPHPVLSRLYRAASLPYLTFNVNDTPSLCPPIPWTSHESGGYIVSKTNLIRLPHQAVQQWERMKAAPLKQLYPCYDSLNQLSSIPWRINTPVLDTIIEVFNNGGSSKLDIPPPQSSFSFIERPSLEMSDDEKLQLYKQRVLLKRQKAETYSQWCDVLYRLSLANHFRDKIFWLPHNMDFRGRVYPCPPHLNHLGSDMPRSMMMFAKGQPLGPNGLDWLKVHVINLTGLRKRNSVADRLEYADSVLPQIIDSAKNPLKGDRWWMESEEPWQTLACCFEINNALNCAEGPENFVSHFPVHQDGSCNGLQHYAALGRDSAGAYSVNLAPAPEPQDVYSAVATIVEKIRSEDASNGIEVAKVLDGFVRRKVVKQTIMTTVYGVTRYGARLQIAKQLKDLDDFPKEFVWGASHYLAAKTFESIRQMFSSTREIQDWFTESAKMISQLCGKKVEYITPLGLPVVQPYIKTVTKQLGTAKSNTGNYHETQIMDMFEKPNVMKQKNAFPPNFIHSLDSSHMMLTSIHCERAGLTFVSVHDCFWTHPSTVEIMNRICRDQFVALHSQPILEDLSKFMFKEFGYDLDTNRDVDDKTKAAMDHLNKLLTTLPRQGDFQLKNVLESVYFFS